MAVELRPLTLADVPAARSLAFASLSRAAEQWEGRALPEPTPAQVALAETRYAHLVTTDPDSCWIALDDGQPAGVALALRRGPMWFLSMFAVAPDRQGHVERAAVPAGLGVVESCARSPPGPLTPYLPNGAYG